MASKTDIANIAIGAHSGDWVDDVDGAPGRTAEAIVKLWPTSLEYALAMHPWKFAKKAWRDQGALPANPDPNRRYAYRRPADCVRVFELAPQDDFDEWGDEQGDCITTNSGLTITMIGTRRNVEVGRFSAAFGRYLGFLLAYDICTAIEASETVRKRCWGDSETALQIAKTDNGRAGSLRPVRPDTFLSARFGGRRF